MVQGLGFRVHPEHPFAGPSLTTTGPCSTKWPDRLFYDVESYTGMSGNLATGFLGEDVELLGFSVP